MYVQNEHDFFNDNWYIRNIILTLIICDYGHTLCVCLRTLQVAVYREVPLHEHMVHVLVHTLAMQPNEIQNAENVLVHAYMHTYVHVCMYTMPTYMYFLLIRM